VYDALRLKNTIQVIGLCVYNVGLLIYAAVQMDQIKQAVLTLTNNNIDLAVWPEVKPFLVAIPCIIALGTVALSVVAWKLYDEFAWTIYKHISADLRMKRRYLTFQVFVSSDAQRIWRYAEVDSPDLHCPSQIRFLLLPWVHRTVPGRCGQHPRR
jgi:hypothetical protein